MISKKDHFAIYLAVFCYGVGAVAIVLELAGKKQVAMELGASAMLTLFIWFVIWGRK